MSEPSATPQTIAEEYLREGKPPFYKENALTLLRVLGGAENVQRIVEIAVKNQDDALRQRAVSELLELGSADKTEAVNALRKIVETDSANQRGLRAYVALGALHETTGGGRDFLRRVHLECRLHEEIPPDKNARFHSRTLVATAIAATAAAALSLLYLSAFGLLRALDASVPAAVILVSVVSALIAAPILTLRSLAFGSHIDRFAGVVAECVWPLTFYLGIYAFSYLTLSLVSDQQTSIKMASFSSIVFTLLVTVVTVLAVRLGAVLARAGAKSLKLNLLWTILSAGSLGALVFTGLLLWKPDSLLSGYYATFVPVIFGIAGAFSAVDGLGTTTEPQAALPRRVLALLAILAFGGLLLAPFRVRSGEFGKVPAGQERSVLVRRLPEVLDFSLSDKTKVFIRVGVKNENPDDSKKLVVDWTLKDSKQEDVLPAKEYSSRQSQPGIPRFLQSGPQDRRTDLTVATELAAGDYSISIKDVTQTSSQKTVFQSVFASLTRRVPLPLISATLFPSMRQKGPSNTEREYSPNQSIDIPYVPFVRSLRITEEQPFVDVKLNGNAGFFPPFRYEIYRDTGLPIVRRQLDFQFRRAPFLKLEPGTYRVVVDQTPVRDLRIAEDLQGFLGPAVPMVERLFKPGESARETTTIPKGLTLNSSLLGPTSAPTVVSGDRPVSADIHLPGLPSVHLVRVVGGSRDVTMTLENFPSDEDLVLDLYNEVGFVKRADDPEIITQKLAPGRYWLVALSIDRRDAKPAGNLVLKIR